MSTGSAIRCFDHGLADRTTVKLQKPSPYFLAANLHHRRLELISELQLSLSAALDDE
jgi:hypothetical protein